MTRDSTKAERFWKHLEPLQGALEAYCRHCVNDPNAAEDVLQEAITVAFRDFDLFAEGTNFRAWIYRYLNLTVLAANRKGQAKPHVALGEEPLAEEDWMLGFNESHLAILLQAPERVLEHCDEVVTTSIRKLNERERATLLLKAIGGFSYREIAEILGQPMGTIMSLLSRARQRLRYELIEYGRKNGLLGEESNEKPS